MMNTEEDVSMSQLLEDDSANDAQTILGEHLINMILAGEPIETVRGIIETGAPLWYQNVSEGMSPLHAAAYAQNSEIVRYLIDEGAIWNAGKGAALSSRFYLSKDSGQLQKHCRRHCLVFQR